MRAFVDAYSIANTVRMLRPVHKGAILIVEGDSDARVYRRFIREPECRIIPALGKANATGALAILEHTGQEGVLCIVDSDYWILNDATPTDDNLLTTDTHDLETMILASPALEKVVDEFGAGKEPTEGNGKEPRKAGEETRTDRLRSVLLDLAAPLGYFRWIAASRKEVEGLNFKHLAAEHYVHCDDISARVDVRALVREVVGRSPVIGVTAPELVTSIENMVKEARYDRWQVCRGHDLVNILTVLLKGCYGNRRARAITVDIIDALLRIAFEYSHFQATALCRSIHEWEADNPAYPILA